MPTLPGVVPNVVLRRNQHTDMVRLLLRVMAWLREAYKTIKKKLQRIRAIILIGVLVVFLIVLVVVLVLVVFGKVLAESTEPPKQLPAPSEQPVPPIGEPSRDPVFSPRSVGAPTFISVRPAADYKSLKVILGAGSAMTETVRFGIGRLEVEGLGHRRCG